MLKLICIGRFFLFSFLLLVYMKSLTAGEFLVHSVLEAETRLWYFNPSECQNGVFRNLKEAADIVNHYSPVALSYQGESAANFSGADDNLNVLGCETLDPFVTSYGSPTAFTDYRIVNDKLMETDIMFAANYFRDRDCVFLHEFAHFIGLGHSEEKNSIVNQYNNCEDKWLYADDLVTIATLYDVPAICTPFVSHSLAIYFPFINGYWVEFRPVNPGNIQQGYYPHDYGKSIPHEWDCQLSHNGTYSEIEAVFYYKGKLIEAVLSGEEGVWYVTAKE